MAGFEAGMVQVSQINNPTAVLSTATLALLANVNRAGWVIQNQGTNPLLLNFGTGATPVNYDIILQKSTAALDGSGTIYSQMAGICYQGIITVSGTGPTYTVAEF